MLKVIGLRRPGLGPTSFEIASGECVVVRGASGSGKTLLLRSVADLDPNEGEVRLDGVARDAMPAPAWRRAVGYVAADSGWWDERVGQHFRSWIAAAPLVEALLLPPDCADWPVGRLSTGERQRLALARAFEQQPRVALLDEPTAALDPAAVAAVEALIERLRGDGLSVLWVSHNAEQARRVARRCLYVDGGHVVEGTP